MKLEDLIKCLEAKSSVAEINPDSPWNWALKHKGDKDFNIIRQTANFLISQNPMKHTPRNYSGGRDSISIIMTSYNSKDYMLPSIFSILKQTHSNLELIIVDDSSTDGTFEFLNILKGIDSRIKVIRTPRNLGTYWGKNLGMLSSKSRFIGFQDSDDICEKNRISRAVKDLMKNHKTVMNFSNYIRIDSSSGKIVLNRGEAQRGALIGMVFDRKRVLDKIGWFDSVRVNADDEMKQRIINVFGKSAITHIDEPDYFASLRPDSLTTSGHTSNNIGIINKDKSQRSFLAPVRQKYTNSYLNWHRGSPRSLYIPYPLWKRPFESPNSIQCEPIKSIQRTTLVFDTEDQPLPGWFENLRVIFDDIILLYSDPYQSLIDKGVPSISTKNGTSKWMPKLIDMMEPGPVVFASTSFPMDKMDVTRLLFELANSDQNIIVGYDGIAEGEGWVDFENIPTGDKSPGPARLLRSNGTSLVWSDFGGWQNAMKNAGSLSELLLKLSKGNNGTQILIPRLEQSSLSETWRDSRFEWLIQHRHFQSELDEKAEEITSLMTMIDLEIDDLLLGQKSEEEVESDYNHTNRWSMKDDLLIFDAMGMDIWFEMPEGWNFDQTHPDLFRLAEHVLIGPWDKTITTGWKPTRKPGHRPGLSFSAGVDSTAAMCLMPQRTVLFYGERDGFDTKLRHDNANRFIKHLENDIGRPVVTVRSNHEMIRTRGGKSPGFSTDYACAVGAILSADLFGLDSIGTGMPLENSYLFHGQKYRDFPDGWFWKHYAPLFEKCGLPLYQPVAGCSEIVNAIIVKEHGFDGFAQSCLRAAAGEVCGACWKCFRKNTLMGHAFVLSNEIETFLQKRPLKMAVSTLYMLQHIKNKPIFKDILAKAPDLEEMIKIDLSWLNYHYLPAMDLIPKQYQGYSTKMLDECVDRMDPAIMKTVNFSQANP